MQNTTIDSQDISSVKVPKAVSAYLKRRANKLHRKSMTAKSNAVKSRLSTDASRTRKYANEIYFSWS